MQLPDVVQRFMPQRERPSLPDDLRRALLAYQNAADHFAARAIMGDWDRLKAALRLWRAASKASRALGRHRDAVRYVFMTAFDQGRMLASEPKRTEILDHACKVFGLNEARR